MQSNRRLLVAVCATAVLACSLLQIGGSPVPSLGDSMYDQFSQMLKLQKYSLELTLNKSVADVQNETMTFTTGKDSFINTTLRECFVSAVNSTNVTDPYCLDTVENEVQEMITRSQKEMQACGNSTFGWTKLASLEGYETLLAELDNITSSILTAAEGCSTRYPNDIPKEYKCMAAAQKRYSGPWDEITKSIVETTIKMNGLGLLLGGELDQCVDKELDSLDDKCRWLLSDVRNCVLPD